MSSHKKFCDRACYREASRAGHVPNAGWFKKGQVSINKGHTLESWVGVERAREIKEKMSLHSKRKGEFLRGLNADKSYLAKRRDSRHFHDDVVLGIARELREKGLRCYVLSEYVKEDRTPDVIVFNGSEITALEVEQEKRYKPSHGAITERLVELNSRSRFFDKTKVVFVGQPELKGSIGTAVNEILSKA